MIGNNFYIDTNQNSCLNRIYRMQAQQSINTIIPTINDEVNKEYKLNHLIDKLSSLASKDFKISNLEQIAKFLSEYNEGLINDVINFFKLLKEATKNQVEIFFIEDDSLKGIYIEILFNPNTSFEEVDKEINKFYDMLDSINNDLWFINIGEKFNEP